MLNNVQEITIQYQGTLVQSKVTLTPAVTPLKAVKSTRGIITEFSRRSRKRLLDLMNRLTLKLYKPVFLTMTYPGEYPDAKTAKRHLANFLKRLKRKFPHASAIWRLEFQERGAPHFHLMIFNMPFWDVEEIRDAWKEIIGYEGEKTLQINIAIIRSRRGVIWYVSKYIAKRTDYDDSAPDGGLLDHLPYLTGRSWGIHNRKDLPLAALTIIVISLAHKAAYFDLRRAVWHVRKAKNKGSPSTGWTLYAGKRKRPGCAEAWLRLTQFYLSQYGTEEP